MPGLKDLFVYCSDFYKELSIPESSGTLACSTNIQGAPAPPLPPSARDAMGSLKGWVAQGPGQDCQGEEVGRRDWVRESESLGAACRLFPKQTHLTSFEAENQRVTSCLFLHYLKEFCTFLPIAVKEFRIRPTSSSHYPSHCPLSLSSITESRERGSLAGSVSGVCHS